MSDVVTGCSWSSGKDSCLALYKTLKEGYKIKHLVNFISGEYKRVTFHGARAKLVKLQSESIGIPLMQRETTPHNYEEIFRKALRELKEKNIRQIVRGDIFLLDLKDWVENICGSEGIKVISPLWGKPARELLDSFISAGFKAVVTSVEAKKLNQSWVGRRIDQRFIEDLSEIKGVDLCGENGEYHSFVFDGPIFKKRIEITKSEAIERNGYFFLDIQEYRLIHKEKE